MTERMKGEISRNSIHDAMRSLSLNSPALQAMRGFNSQRQMIQDAIRDLSLNSPALQAMRAFDSQRQMMQDAMRSLSLNSPALQAIRGVNSQHQMIQDAIRSLSLNSPALQAMRGFNSQRQMIQDAMRTLRGDIDALFDQSRRSALRSVADSFRNLNVDQYAVREMLLSLQEHAVKAEVKTEDIEEMRHLIEVDAIVKESRSIGDVLDWLLNLLDRIENPNLRNLVISIIGGLISCVIFAGAQGLMQSGISCRTPSRSDGVRDARSAIVDRIAVGDTSIDLNQLRIVNNYEVRIHGAPRRNSAVVGIVELPALILVFEKRRKWVLIAFWDSEGKERQGWVRSKYLDRVEPRH